MKTLDLINNPFQLPPIEEVKHNLDLSNDIIYDYSWAILFTSKYINKFVSYCNTFNYLIILAYLLYYKDHVQLEDFKLVSILCKKICGNT